MMQKITGLIWLEEVIEKIAAKHHLSQAEVEEAFIGEAKVRKMNRGHFRGEHVYRLLGETQGGRCLTVFYIYKRSQEALILSARDMDRKERKSYGRK